MGYLVTGHVLTSEPDPKRLSALPPDVCWSLYRHDAPRIWLLDTFRKARPNRWPFTEVILRGDKSELASHAPALTAVIEEMIASRIEMAGYGHWLLSRQISDLLQAQVFSFASDDDVMQLTCTCDRGRILSARRDTELLEIRFEHPAVSVTPLAYEEDRDLAPAPELLTKLAALPGVKVESARMVAAGGGRLHGIVLDDWPPAAGDPVQLLSLGSFDSDLAKAVARFSIVDQKLPAAKAQTAQPPARGTPMSPPSPPKRKGFWRRLFGG